MTVRQAQPEDLDAVRALCWAFRDVLLDVHADRPEVIKKAYPEDTYTALLNGFPGKHIAPDGAIFVGLTDGAVTGCGMTHRLDAQTCEIKRLFVAPEGRGQGLARAILQAAMDQARADGYARFVLDTSKRLKPAIQLYEKIGFQPIAAFYDPPPEFADLLLFFGVDL